MVQRIGVYPGSFDPVHAGHIAFALAAMQVCKLSAVYFLPEARPRHKPQVTDLAHRVELLHKAFADQPNVHVMQLASSQFSVKNSLDEIRSHFGGAELTLLMGSDVAAGLSQGWPDVDKLLRAVSLAIGLRAGDDAKTLTTTLQQIEARVGVPVRYTLVTTAHEHAKLASSQIRSGASATATMQPVVLDYIRKHNLYSQTPFSTPYASD